MSTLPADGFRTPAANGSSRIRQVEETDLPELVRLAEEAFPEGPYPFFTLRQLFDLYPDHMLVLDGGANGLHGYVLVGMPRDAGRGWILSLGVTRDQRGRGHGRQLM
jgi:ribosomal-protein-alanine N-acetyltransferase